MADQEKADRRTVGGLKLTLQGRARRDPRINGLAFRLLHAFCDYAKGEGSTVHLERRRACRECGLSEGSMKQVSTALGSLVESGYLIDTGYHLPGGRGIRLYRINWQAGPDDSPAEDGPTRGEITTSSEIAPGQSDFEAETTRGEINPAPGAKSPPDQGRNRHIEYPLYPLKESPSVNARDTREDDEGKIFDFGSDQPKTVSADRPLAWQGESISDTRSHLSPPSYSLPPELRPDRLPERHPALPEKPRIGQAEDPLSKIKLAALEGIRAVQDKLDQASIDRWDEWDRYLSRAAVRVDDMSDAELRRLLSLVHPHAVTTAGDRQPAPVECIDRAGAMDELDDQPDPLPPVSQPRQGLPKPPDQIRSFLAEACSYSSLPADAAFKRALHVRRAIEETALTRLRLMVNKLRPRGLDPDRDQWIDRAEKHLAAVEADARWPGPFLADEEWREIIEFAWPRAAVRWARARTITYKHHGPDGPCIEAVRYALVRAVEALPKGAQADISRRIGEPQLASFRCGNVVRIDRAIAGELEAVLDAIKASGAAGPDQVALAERARAFVKSAKGGRAGLARSIGTSEERLKAFLLGRNKYAWPVDDARRLAAFLDEAEQPTTATPPPADPPSHPAPDPAFDESAFDFSGWTEPDEPQPPADEPDPDEQHFDFGDAAFEPYAPPAPPDPAVIRQHSADEARAVLSSPPARPIPAALKPIQAADPPALQPHEPDPRRWFLEHLIEQAARIVREGQDADIGFDNEWMSTAIIVGQAARLDVLPPELLRTAVMRLWPRALPVLRQAQRPALHAIEGGAGA